MWCTYNSVSPRSHQTNPHRIIGQLNSLHISGAFSQFCECWNKSIPKCFISWRLNWIQPTTANITYCIFKWESDKTWLPSFIAERPVWVVILISGKSNTISQFHCYIIWNYILFYYFILFYYIRQQNSLRILGHSARVFILFCSIVFYWWNLCENWDIRRNFISFKNSSFNYE